MCGWLNRYGTDCSAVLCNGTKLRKEVCGVVLVCDVDMCFVSVLSNWNM